MSAGRKAEAEDHHGKDRPVQGLPGRAGGRPQRPAVVRSGVDRSPRARRCDVVTPVLRVQHREELPSRDHGLAGPVLRSGRCRVQQGRGDRALDGVLSRRGLEAVCGALGLRQRERDRH
ncbi:hypothetical protein QU39_00370 [Staphylococcus aureus]|nr:hypothetical protein QU39_00370 [Staphylococcus aureus]